MGWKVGMPNELWNRPRSHSLVVRPYRDEVRSGPEFGPAISNLLPTTTPVVGGDFRSRLSANRLLSSGDLAVIMVEETNGE